MGTGLRRATSWMNALVFVDIHDLVHARDGDVLPRGGEIERRRRSTDPL